MGPLGRGPPHIVTVCNQNFTCQGGGSIDNDILCSCIACNNTSCLTVNTVERDKEIDTNLKCTVTSFNKVCDNVDLSNTVNSNSSLPSANMRYDRSGYYAGVNNNMFTNQLNVDNLASPYAFDHIRDRCIYGTKLVDTYIWPIQGKVDNCIVHFTNTYWFDTCDTSTCIVYIQGSCHRGWFLWNQNMYSGKFLVTKCSHPPAGYLQIGSSVNVSIVFHEPVNKAQAQLAHSNYVQDTFYHEVFGCSYVSYLENIIDKLSACQFVSDDATGGHHQPENKVFGAVAPTPPVPMHKHASFSNAYPDLDAVHDHVLSDFFDPTKKLGFLVLEDSQFQFIGPDRASPSSLSLNDYISMAKSIRSTGLPNYRQARFPVHSDLNIQAWESLLKDSPNTRLLDYLKFGFPLSLCNHEFLANKDIVNHFSALQHPSAVTEYLQKEVKLGAILGPFEEVPYHEFHCSPLLTRPKDVDKRRVILNLSYPRTNSVNDRVTRDFFDGQQFLLKFPTVDNIIDQIKTTEGRVLLAKIDIARAFRNLRIDPADTFKFGLKWQNKYYLDVSAAFGWVHGSAAFQLTSDAISDAMRRKGRHIFAYIDDYILVSTEDSAYSHFEDLYDLISDLGLPINLDKKTPPTRRLTCLGISFDLDANTLSIGKNKLQEIYAECLQVSTKTYLTRRKFQSLLGKLMYLHKVIKPARVFVNRMLATCRNNFTATKIKLSKEFFQDLRWFLTFLPSFNGTSKIVKSPIPDNNKLFIDACLTGVGGIWGHRVYAAPIPQFLDFHPSITHLEMLNLLVALRLWASHWAQSSVYIYCDNMAVVQVASSGRTKDPFLGACIRNIWLITATYDIELEIKHIQGSKNILADALSRIYSDKGINYDLFQMLKKSCVWEEVHHSLFHLSYLV